jgi:hypothetical protein
LCAIRHQPSLWMRPGVARQLAATLFGIERYNALKARFTRRG